MNSRDKGKRGELEFAHFLKNNHGIDARRGQQFSGGNESPDVVGVPGLHLEVKRVESLNIHAAVAQATKDANGLPWAVAHRRNGGKWLVTVDANHYFNLRTTMSELIEKLGELETLASDGHIHELHANDTLPCLKDGDHTE